MMNFPHAFQLYTKARTPDTKGGHTATWNLSIAEVRGRQRPASTGEREVGQKNAGVTSHVVLIPLGVTVQRGNKLTNIQTSEELKVLNVVSPSKASHLTCFCEQMPIDTASQS